MSNTKAAKYFSTNISKKQSSDSGMAAVLILLLIGFFTENSLFYKISIPVLIMNMVFPMFFYPFAILWFALSNFLGTIVSKVLMSIIYFLFVIPVGMIRQLFGKDPLLLKEFKKSSKSVFKSRNIRFTSKDIETPY